MAKIRRKQDQRKPSNKPMLDKLKSGMGQVPPQGDPGRRKFHFSLWYFLLAFLVITLVHDYLQVGKVDRIPYSEFRSYVQKGEVTDLVLGTQEITGKLLAPAPPQKGTPLPEKGATPAEKAAAAAVSPAPGTTTPAAREATLPVTPAAGGVAATTVEKEATPAATPAGESTPATSVEGILAGKTGGTPEKPAAGKGRPFITVRVDDPDLVKLLDQNKISYKGQYESKWMTTLLAWIIPIAILVIVWQFLMGRMMGGAQGVLSVGKARAKIYAEKDVSVTFDDVAGIDEAKHELAEIVEFLKTPQKFTSLGGKIPKGVLLVGGPGTGKTLLARAVAGEAGVTFFSMSGSDFVEMFVGVGAARVRDLFAQAKLQAPCIIFIDELDALGKARGLNPIGGHDEREQTLNQLLVEMDGFDANTGVIIMAATNRPEILDPALLRPGRFDRHVAIDRPDVRGREAILKIHTRQVKLAPDVDLGKVAALTPGFVGADLANLVNEAALLSARRGKKNVSMTEFQDSIDRIVGGLEKKNRMMNAQEKKIVAYHESGHALTAMNMPTADPVNKITIIPRGIAALGYTQQLPTEDRYLMTRTELVERLCVLLGGRVAEEIIFGDISTGAQNDLQRATDMARSMVVEYGMSEKMGLVTYGREKRPLFLDTLGSVTKEYSEETAREIDKEVARLISEAHIRVREVLTKKRDTLELLTRTLLEKETIAGDDLKKLLGDQLKTTEEEKPQEQAGEPAS